MIFGFRVDIIDVIDFIGLIGLIRLIGLISLIYLAREAENGFVEGEVEGQDGFLSDGGVDVAGDGSE